MGMMYGTTVCGPTQWGRWICT